MRYEVPVHVTVDVFSEDNVVKAAKAEVQRRFDLSDEEWDGREQPFIDEHFGHALAIVLASEAVSGAVAGILERTIRGLEISGYGVSSSQVVANPDGWARRTRNDDSASGDAG